MRNVVGGLAVGDSDGVVRVAMNVAGHAAGTSGDVALGTYLSHLIEAGERVSRDWAAWQARPIVDMARCEKNAHTIDSLNA